jgi:hypothetical protein
VTNAPCFLIASDSERLLIAATLNAPIASGRVPRAPTIGRVFRSDHAHDAYKRRINAVGRKRWQIFVGLASIQCCRHTPLAGIRAWGMVMRINTMIVFQAIIATLSGIAVMYLQRRIAGPLGGIIPGVLGFLIGWLVTAAIPDDIESLRRWLRRRASRELQPK